MVPEKVIRISPTKFTEPKTGERQKKQTSKFECALELRPRLSPINTTPILSIFIPQPRKTLQAGAGEGAERPFACPGPPLSQNRLEAVQ